MNKGDLVGKVAEVLSSKKDAQAAVDCVLATISEALAEHKTVTLVGFGTFKTSERKARKGRNPQTGKEIDIPARNVPKFVPGKALKDSIK
ncbi:MAG: HU family DNA-binding protein [Desulfamplus sp.]|nr:HU family DNA-binding protein [Desulfamplus sp.]MBF0210448.1 HU family DNA-binding protein [Desulfamplus sp.]MBF0240852.1 HU family DNA-binding protein [Desulfamplus sp.]MBF0388947.1 HU family DNA-binding protein [Desulfamplus sp.]